VGCSAPVVDGPLKFDVPHGVKDPVAFLFQVLNLVSYVPRRGHQLCGEYCRVVVSSDNYSTTYIYNLFSLKFVQ
jgi:hypothetical protein